MFSSFQANDDKERKSYYIGEEDSQTDPHSRPDSEQLNMQSEAFADGRESIEDLDVSLEIQLETHNSDEGLSHFGISDSEKSCWENENFSERCSIFTTLHCC